MGKKRAKIQPISLTEKFRKFDTVWAHYLLGEFNGQQIRLDRFIGPFFWHRHEDDIVYIVFKGEISVKLEGRDSIEVSGGELVQLPANTNHLVTALQGAEVIILCAPRTSNTGNVINDFTQTGIKQV